MYLPFAAQIYTRFSVAIQYNNIPAKVWHDEGKFPTTSLPEPASRLGKR